MAYTANLSTVLSEVNTITSNYSSAVYNYLRPNAFRFTIKDLPHVAYTCQSANLPSIQLGAAIQPTPFVDVPRIGDKLDYNEFTIRFLIAEDMVNYIELLEWMIALGFPNSYNDYPNFVGERLNRFPFFKTSSGSTDALAYSDGTLTILNSSNIPAVNVVFKDLFPTSVEALDFDITGSAVDFFVGVASFRYTTFNIETL